MKKQLLFLITVLFAFTALNAQTVVYEDDFESYADGYNLTDAGYAVWEGTAKVVDVTVQTEMTANKGNKFGQSDVSKNSFAFRKALTLEAGKTYKWDIATKMTGGVKYVLQVNPTATYQLIELFNTEWETHSAIFTVKTGSEDVVLAIYRWAKQTVSFDDFKLTEIDPVGKLSELSVSEGTLLPNFDLDVFNYTVELPSGTLVTPTITATAIEDGATVEITNATDVTSATEADRTSTVKVTSGTTVNTYSIVFNVVSLSDDATLKELTISTGTLTPAFDAGTLNYTATLPAGSDAAPTVTATPNDDAASADVTDASDVTSATDADRTTTILVTAEDGSKQTYSILFSVAEPLSDDATLKELTISTGTLTPAFDAGTLNYTATLPAGSDAAPTVTATPNDDAASADVTDASDVTSATDADRTTTIIVTAEDGSKQTYSILFSVAEPLSDDATLKELTISTGTLTPTFDAGTLNYTAILPAGSDAAPTVTATPNDDAASADVTDASDVTSTTDADRTTTILVTAEDGSKQTYTILFNVEVNTSISNVNANRFEIYPNPAKDYLSIRNAIDIKTIEIISLTGQIVKHINYFNPNQQLDISDLHKGYYFLKITSKDLEVHSNRLIVE